MEGLDQQKLEAFAGKMLVELGAAAAGALIVLGDRLGLYQALAEMGPATPEQLASATGTTERYVREWLSAQAASGYLEYDKSQQKFFMTPEQAAVLAYRESPAYMGGGYYGIAAAYMDEPKISAAFQSGKGVGWEEHSECLFCGTERFFGPVYRAHLVGDWIPALSGIREKLQTGGSRVADIGCGHGISTMLMAQAFPEAQFYGFDFHPRSIQKAREHAANQNIKNIEFHIADAQTFPDGKYDLVTMFDCLHDMGDPLGAARRVKDTLDKEGSFMIVEPSAGDRLEENLNPVGRAYYCFSTMICVPASLSQPGKAALGAQAGEAKLAAVLKEAGFNTVKRAAETPTNMVLEARL